MPDPISGKDATFKKDAAALVVDVLQWTIEPAGGESRYGSDKTGGHKVAWATINDYNAAVIIKVPATGNVPWNRGDVFAAQFHIDDSGNNYLSGDVIVLSDPLDVDIDEDETIEKEYSLGPRSPLVYHGLLWSGAGSSGIPNAPAA